MWRNGRSYATLDLDLHEENECSRYSVEQLYRGTCTEREEGCLPPILDVTHIIIHEEKRRRERESYDEGGKHEKREREKMRCFPLSFFFSLFFPFFFFFCRPELLHRFSREENGDQGALR